MRSDSLYEDEISDPSGDLYRPIGHHGPAVENEWLALNEAHGKGEKGRKFLLDGNAVRS